jgi:NTE family protein
MEKMLDKQNIKIGIALSGGGIRAAIYHLGVFKYLAEEGLFGKITHISSVSGASPIVALILAKNSNKWPSDQDYLERVLPEVERTVLQRDVQKTAVRRLPFSPGYWNSRAALIARVMRDIWQITGSLQDLPDSPKWDINATTFETGRDFRFNKERMGDYQIGYVRHPDFPIACAVAASEGFPIMIGPLKLDAGKYQWDKPPREKTYYLWDGGLYEIFGIEALYKPGTGLVSDINFLIISNASCSSGYLHRNSFSSIKNMHRLLDITTDQIAALRSREIMTQVVKQNYGLYFNIGNSARKIAEDSGVDAATKERLIAACMPPEKAQWVRHYGTSLNSPPPADYQLIARHGYENAMCTCTCYAPSLAVVK